MKKIKISAIQLLGLFLVLSVAVGLTVHFYDRSIMRAQVSEVPISATEQVVYPHIISPRSTLYNVLKELGVSSQVIQQIVTATKPVIDLGRLRAGTQFRMIHLTDPTSQLVGLEFYLSPVERILIKNVEGFWQAEKVTEVVETKLVTFRGVVETTLWESAEAAQMDPNLIVQLSEIFAWQVDFAREVRINDRWRISIEQKFVRGQAIGWGSILAAEFENEGQLYTAILFKTGPEQYGYYAADGSSLRRMFLKSPIRFGRVTSGFNMRRFHPVLKVRRPHLGVDYGAPVGTPIRSVGNGVVTHAGWMGGGGNTVKIRHNSTYETAYLHLSRIEKGIRPGAKVQQAQVIGAVGQTGLATGPHLHFEFKQNGRVVNPLSQKFPSAEPVPNQLMAEFKVQSGSMLGRLPSWEGLKPFLVRNTRNLSRFFVQPAHGRFVEE